MVATRDKRRALYSPRCATPRDEIAPHGCYTFAMGFNVTEIQPTPNPNAAKFMLDRAVSEQPTSFFNAAAAKGHALAEKLFEIPGVTSLLLLGDFLTVNKSPDADWSELAARVRAVLASA